MTVVSSQRKATGERLTARQQLALEAVMDPMLYGNISELCRQINVDRSTFYRWFDKNPYFREQWEQAHLKSIKRAFPFSAQALNHRASSGDVAAIQLAARIAGYLQPESQPPSVSIQQIFNQFDLSPEQKARVLERLSPETRAMLPDVIEATAEAKE